jgi:tetratricopeptide (TPR) repeat protein
VLQGLAVFRGAFDSADALAVLDPVFGAEPVRAALRTLIERRLLCRDSTIRVAGSAPCYVLLDSIRHWLLERADGLVQWNAVRASHASAFRQRTIEAFAVFRLGQNPKAMALYEPAERDIEAGIEWQGLHGDTAQWLQWQHEAGMLQMTRGGVFEAIAHLREAVGRPVYGDEQRRHRAWCWFALSIPLAWIGDVPGSVFALRQARQGSIGCGDERLAEKIGEKLAILRCSQMRMRAASLHIEAVIRRCESIGERQRKWFHLCTRGAILTMQGRYHEALAVAESAFDLVLIADVPYMAWLIQHWLAEVSLRHGLIARAREYVADYTVAESLGFGGLPRFEMRRLEFLLDFESEQYACAQNRLADWRALATGAHERRAVMVELGAEFLMMESEREAEVCAMVSDGHSIIFSDEDAEFYVQMHCYRLRLLSRRGRRHDALVSLACVLQPIRRCGNPLWASWLAEALAIIAVQLGDHANGRRFLELSQQLQREAGIVPTPRQMTSWRRVGATIEPSPARLRVVRAGSARSMPLPHTVDRLEQWARGALGGVASAVARGHAARPAEQAPAVVRRQRT